MAKMVLFKPKSTATAQENMLTFLALGKQLTALGAREQFEKDIWSVGDIFGKNKNIYFLNSDGAPLIEPFRSFSKSLLSYLHSFEPHRMASVLEDILYALRSLESVCKQNKSFAFENLSGIELDAAIEEVKKSNLSSSSQYKRGASLSKIAKFLSEQMLVVGPLVWSNPIQKPYNLAQSSKNGGDEARAKKLPSQASMDAIPQIFFLAHQKGGKDIVAQVATSYCVLLMSNPSRARELLEQPLDILVGNFSSTNHGLGLRWWPKKGGTPIVKPVLGPFEDVVRKAYQSLVDNSAEARKIAKWYEGNPQKMYLPNELEGYRKKTLLNREDINKLLFGGEYNRTARTSVQHWIKAHKLTHVKEVVKEVSTRSRQWIKFSDFEASVLSHLPKDLLSRSGSKKYSELLFLTRGKGLRGSWSHVQVLFGHISYDSIFNCLSGGRNGTKSIFALYGYSNADGTPITLNTHQFRHWLNTLAQLAGLSQLDIAIWSGRKNIAQNEVYNHITPEQRLERLRNMVGDRNLAVGGLGNLPKVIPIKRSDYAAAKIPTAHVTDFGYCIHDFSFEPCQLHRDCLSCNDHVCVKGDKPAEDRLDLKLEETKRLLHQAKKALGEEEYGADRWVEHNTSVVERLESLKAILNDQSIEKGAIIQLSNPTAPSRLKEALDSRVKLVLPKTKGVLIYEQENAKRVEVIKSEKARKSKKSSKPRR
jgi:hypothetical protein